MQSHIHHPREFMPPALPYVQFKEEPPLISEQVAALGGFTVRHNFGTRCYNPGLTKNRWKNQLAHLRSDFLMTYRSQEIEARGDHKIAVSNLSICGIDHSGLVRWTAPLQPPEMEGIGTAMQEDGRLFWFNDALFLAYSNVRLRMDSVSFKQSLVRLNPILPDSMFSAHVFKPGFEAGPLKHLRFGNNDPIAQGQEKNWQFFEDDGELAFVYSIHPHVVYHPVSRKTSVSMCKAGDDWTSTWGDMHGGTPPIRLPNGRFLSFFNSFVGHVEHQRRYVIGAYIFEGDRRKGYRIVKITNRPLLIGTEREGFLWESPAYWEPIVVFATGAIYHEKQNAIRLSYGVNDCFSESALFPMDALMERMVRV